MRQSSGVLSVTVQAEWTDFQVRHCWHQCSKQRSETSVLATPKKNSNVHVSRAAAHGKLVSKCTLYAHSEVSKYRHTQALLHQLKVPTRKHCGSSRGRQRMVRQPDVKEWKKVVLVATGPHVESRGKRERGVSHATLVFGRN